MASAPYLPAGGVPALLPLEDLPVFTPNPRLLDSHVVVGFDTSDSRARPFNLLRSQVAKRMVKADAKLVGIASATPNAGKSFMCLNLAAALSRLSADQTVYLVDLDLRRGSIAEGLGIDVEVGISDFLLSKTDDLASLGMRIDGTRLCLFPTRTVTANSAELLSGERLLQLIQAFRQHTGDGIVLFDLPPVFANDDAMIVIEQLDGYFIVVDSGKTTRRQVQETLVMLEPTECLGAILNRYKGGFLDIYGYGYGYGAYDRQEK